VEEGGKYGRILGASKTEVVRWKDWRDNTNARAAQAEHRGLRNLQTLLLLGPLEAKKRFFHLYALICVIVFCAAWDVSGLPFSSMSGCFLEKGFCITFFWFPKRAFIFVRFIFMSEIYSHKNPSDQK
jgi:hypothetical protein